MKNPIASKKKRFDKVRARLYCIQKEKFDEVYESLIYEIWLHPKRKIW